MQLWMYLNYQQASAKYMYYFPTLSISTSKLYYSTWVNVLSYFSPLTTGSAEIIHFWTVLKDEFPSCASLSVNAPRCASRPGQQMALLTALRTWEAIKKLLGPFSVCKAEVLQWSARPRSTRAEHQGKHWKRRVVWFRLSCEWHFGTVFECLLIHNEAGEVRRRRRRRRRRKRRRTKRAKSYVT